MKQTNSMVNLEKPELNPLLIVVTGPTAVGKTKIAIQLAQHFKTEIVSADSRQFYKELKIGTAAPTPEELKAAKHHFIGNLSIHDYYNASIYENQALTLLNSLFRKNKVILLTGGSGLYIDAVCKGIDDLPDPDAELRKKIFDKYKSEGITALQKELKELDPDYYDIVDKANPKRLMRAIEVCIQTGVPFSSLRKYKPKPRPFRVLKIGLNLPREALFEKINQRVDNMIASGLIEEAKVFSHSSHLNALNTVGYKEIYAFLNSQIGLEQAVTDIKTNTRRYAKRQLTWFKKDPDIHWFSPTNYPEIVALIEKTI